MLDFLPTAPLKNLRKRAEIIQKIRRFFDSRGFVEVQTPVLSHDTVMDAFVEPITVYGLSGAADTVPFYLQTSPEFAMKRLIAAGMSAIYQITPAFRRGDRGSLHNIEFSMLEWYRAGDDYQQGRRFLGEFIQSLNENQQVEECSFGTIFEQYTGLNPYWCSVSALQNRAVQRSLSFPASYLSEKSPASRNDWIDLIFSEEVQPKIGRKTPMILYDYPVEQSQLAETRWEKEKASQRTWQVSERFEIFIQGVELANGYHELRDPAVLRQRIQETAAIRRNRGLPELPAESRLLQAMESGLPPCCGCALGIDRLLMVLLNAETIDDVLAFPVERA